MSLEYLNEYKYKELPIPPTEVVNYAKKKLSEPGYELNIKFWKRSDIAGYLEALSKWQSINISNFSWLKHLLEENPKEFKIAQMLREFNQKDWYIFGNDMLKELAGFSSVPI